MMMIIIIIILIVLTHKHSLHLLIFLYTHFYHPCAVSVQSIITNVQYTPSSACSMVVVLLYISVSQMPGRGPVPGHGIDYTGAQEVLLEFVILVF